MIGSDFWPLETVRRVEGAYSVMSYPSFRVPPEDEIRDAVIWNLARRIEERIGLDIDRRDCRIGPARHDQSKCHLTRNARWRPDVRRVALLGGRADGQMVNATWENFDPIEETVNVALTTPLPGLIHACRGEREGSVLHEAYRRIGWAPRERAWVFGPVNG